MKTKNNKKKISEEIQELIRQNKEPNLKFIISHPETNSTTTTEKHEDFTFYDYVGHNKKTYFRKTTKNRF